MKNQVIFGVLCLWIINIISIFLLVVFLIQDMPKEELTKETVEVYMDTETVNDPNIVELKVVSFTQEDLKYLSSIIYCEAGNQCQAGKEAVGIVVLNRVENEKFEDTIKGVIYQKGQFTPVSSGSINTALRMYDSSTLPVECVSAAIYALEGNNSVEYEEEQYNIEDYLYFCRSSKGSSLQIEDHYFK